MFEVRISTIKFIYKYLSVIRLNACSQREGKDKKFSEKAKDTDQHIISLSIDRFCFILIAARFADNILCRTSASIQITCPILGT